MLFILHQSLFLPPGLTSFQSRVPESVNVPQSTAEVLSQVAKQLSSGEQPFATEEPLEDSEGLAPPLGNKQEAMQRSSLLSAFVCATFPVRIQSYFRKVLIIYKEKNLTCTKNSVLSLGGR